jgi:hypothetical protein
MFHTQKLKKILRLHQEALIWASWDRKNFKIVSACCHSEAFSLIELRGQPFPQLQMFQARWRV